jgi:hypothetical protein
MKQNLVVQNYGSCLSPFISEQLRGESQEELGVLKCVYIAKSVCTWSWLNPSFLGTLLCSQPFIDNLVFATELCIKFASKGNRASVLQR